MVPPLTLCAYMKKGPNLRWSLIQCSGGDEGDRTPDLLTASQALSQLSYAPVRRSTIRELPRRCKDNFGKLSAERNGCVAYRAAAGSGRAGTVTPGPARGAVGAGARACAPRGPIPTAGRAPRAAAIPPPTFPGPVPPPFGPPATKPGHLLRLAGRPRGTLTRNPPIYYFWAAPLDHTAAGKIKTAGRRLAVFAKQRLWSRGRVKK